MDADGFGCVSCRPESPEAAWEAKRAFVRGEDLVDESHEMIYMQSCGACQQLYVVIAEEFVDWADSDDSQFWTVIPVSADEAQSLRAQGASLTPDKARSVGARRRVLRRDAPKGNAPRVSWA